MLEAEIIAHCAPTLAGIKTANMFPLNHKVIFDYLFKSSYMPV